MASRAQQIENELLQIQRRLGGAGASGRQGASRAQQIESELLQIQRRLGKTGAPPRPSARRAQQVESELLLTEHRMGKAGALGRLVKLWERPLYYYLRRLVDSEDAAKDVAQEVWLSVVRKVHTLRDPGAFPAWLYRVARNAAASHFRKAPPFDPLPEDDDIADESEISSVPNAEELHWALTQLNPAHSECLILHFLEGFSIDEIGDITGAPAGTVKSRIHYAKRALRDLLEKEAERNAKR